MKTNVIEEDVVVHPVDGMQLSEGTIREDRPHHFSGQFPGMEPDAGDTVVEVLSRMEQKAKAYYGDDVVVEIVHHARG